MTGLSRTAVVVAVIALVASLALVAWRQSRARNLLVDLEEVRQERALAEAEAAKLVRRVHRLESRGRVVRAARERLGMYVPETSEIVILPPVGE